jgi:hypothetical protein
LELILDFNEEISTSGGVLGVKTRDLDGDGDEIIDDGVNDVSDTALTVVGLDRGDEGEVSTLKVDLDLENGRPHVDLVLLDVELVSHELHA